MLVPEISAHDILIEVALFLELAAAMEIHPHTEVYRSEDANQALYDLKC